MKKFTRDRVVPAISASVSCEIAGTARTGSSCLPYRASNRSGASEPLLGGVEQLIDEVLLDPDVPRQHVRDEPIRQRMLLVKQSHHLILVDAQDRAVGRRHRTPHPDRLTSQAPFAEELTSPEHRHDGFPARLGEHRELHVTLLDVQHVFARIAWVNMTSPRRYSTIFLATPAESRKACALKIAFFFVFMVRVAAKPQPYR